MVTCQLAMSNMKALHLLQMSTLSPTITIQYHKKNDHNLRMDIKYILSFDTHQEDYKKTSVCTLIST